MKNAKLIAAVTLGCKVNAYDTQAMLEIFYKNGYEYADFDGAADIYLINTCTVTSLGDKKTRQMIRKAKNKNKDAIVIAAGCFSQMKPREAQLCGADIVIGTQRRGRIMQILREYQDGSGSANITDVPADVSSTAKTADIPADNSDSAKTTDIPANISDNAKITDIPYASEFEELTIGGYDNHTRAYVKIQDGCDNFCAYCIVPYARGRSRSRKFGDCVSECEKLAENGFKEIVLSGIHLASYGKDLQREKLPDIIKAAQAINGIERIRLGSLDPRLINDEFLEQIKTCSKLCDHFHLSLQSGCDKTLSAMGRKYDTEFFEDAVMKIRRHYPNAALTTDIIVGFPGESAYDFEQSMDFCARVRFAKMHIFPFSAKKGTKAYDMAAQVKSGEKKARTESFRTLSDRLRGEFLDANEGRLAPVLFERVSEGVCEGYTTNYIAVRSDKAENSVNSIKIMVLSRSNIK